MVFQHLGLYDLARMEQAKQARDAQRYRRVEQTRSEIVHNAAARSERRFAFVRRAGIAGVRARS